MPTVPSTTLPQVLLVEDNLPTAELTAEIITFLGHSVLLAHNGRDAVAMARLHQPALVLMDVQMPGMDGLTATRLLKQDAATADIPVICLTALAMEKEAALCLAAGADMHLAKPVNFQLLEEILKRYLGMPSPEG